MREYLSGDGIPRKDWPAALRLFGPFHYITSGLVIPQDEQQRTGEEWVHSMQEDREYEEVSVAERMRGRVSTLAGAWWLLKTADANGFIETTRVAPPLHIVERERESGVLPSKITYGRARPSMTS